MILLLIFTKLRSTALTQLVMQVVKSNCSLLNLLSYVSLLIIVLYSTPSAWLSIFALLWVTGVLFLLAPHWLGVLGVTVVALRLVGLLLFKSMLLWYDACFKAQATYITVGSYGRLTDNYGLNLQFSLDSYSLSYILLTTTIGLWALLFATNYMRNEPRVLQFIVLLYFFLISMILLLASGNFPTLMLGWELIGCFSFLLINFWTTRVATAKSAFKAFFVNKLSDACLILSLLCLLLFVPTTFSLNMANLYVLQGLCTSVLGVTVNCLDIFVTGLIVCSFCKSAQFGFHVWLPDSMEAPVPASALIHSATLVSAGMFLLGRSEVLTSLGWACNLLLLWCSFTALYGGVVAAYQTDLKKILAYSTISHCGFLILLVVYNNFAGLVLYLHLHGWFKSYSFMAAGNIITKSLGYQDYRRMGGGAYSSTLEHIVLVTSMGCLGGLPFTLGFFNKHYLLMLGSEEYLLFANAFTLAAAFTGLFYTLKTLSALLTSSYKGPSFNHLGTHNGNSPRGLLSSEPTSNLILLGLYPVVIALLTVSVLSLDYWVGAVVTHSLFGVMFFYLYFMVAAVFTKWSWLPTILSLVAVKLFYIVLCL